MNYPVFKIVVYRAICNARELFNDGVIYIESSGRMSAELESIWKQTIVS
jgi:hypothetical protein